ncbi:MULTISPECIES: cupin domain-containing protein [Tsukamurella]|uniref:cupin domain-containing protein n=1 Tax=Tsukamurella TaxID=2060 RepID=UPI001E563E3D|nr:MULTISPECIES: cupin domain-containing protein [Tsukamurella]
MQDPEIVGGEDGPQVALFVDAAATGGAVSVQRVHLPAGADGASPHFHTRSTEVFHILDGALEMLIGDELRVVAAGGLAVIPPDTVHAFAAHAGRAATALIVLTPGVERFGYFRLLRDVASGAAAPSELLAAQDEYDNHFVDSPLWRERPRG